jgi:ABC-2 type transport system ATP-binding protein
MTYVTASNGAVRQQWIAQEDNAMKDARAPQVAAELQAVHKSRGKTLALAGVDLTLRRGRCTALLGPNGAGKTTAVSLLTGRLVPDQGRALLFGGDPRDLANRQHMGVMLQEAGLPRVLTVAEQIDLFRGYYPDPRARETILEMAGLNDLEKRRCGALSGGQQRRLQFALAIAGRPDLLVLDEPTTGMDIDARRGLWTSVREEVARGAAVLLTTHHMEEAEALADDIVVISNGRIVAEGSSDVIKSTAASSSIRCRTILTDAQLTALARVLRVEREGGRVTLLTASAPDTLRQLLAADLSVEDLSVSGASLEDAFLQLVTPREAVAKEIYA